jgi:hypothetical protein
MGDELTQITNEVYLEIQEWTEPISPPLPVTTIDDDTAVQQKIEFLAKKYPEANAYIAGPKDYDQEGNRCSAVVFYRIKPVDEVSRP